MKVLLIEPNIEGYALMPSMSLAVLKKEGIEVKILEANAFNLNHDQIKKAIIDYSPEFVGITSTTSLIEEAHEIALLCNKNIKVIIGGIHASSMPEETLKKFTRFDYLIRREGEYTMLELVQNENLLKNMQKKAYREFYFRPKIILKSFKHIRDMEKFKLYLNAGTAFLKLK